MVNITRKTKIQKNSRKKSLISIPQIVHEALDWKPDDELEWTLTVSENESRLVVSHKETDSKPLGIGTVYVGGERYNVFIVKCTSRILKRQYGVFATMIPQIICELLELKWKSYLEWTAVLDGKCNYADLQYIPMEGT